MISPDPNEIANGIIVIWVLWVTGVSALVTFVFGKQRKEVNAAFKKIRNLEEKTK